MKDCVVYKVTSEGRSVAAPQRFEVIYKPGRWIAPKVEETPRMQVPPPVGALDKDDADRVKKATQLL